MSESLFDYDQQPRTQTSESDVALGGIAGVFNKIRGIREARLENKLENLEYDLSLALQTPTVNQITAQWTLESGVGLTKASEAVTTAHEGSHKPATDTERGIVSITERTLKKNFRQASVAQSLETIYNRKDPDKQLGPVRDRRAGVGNRPTRTAIDERLRRQGLLNDQKPQPLLPKVRVGSERHSEVVSDERLSRAERRRIKRAGKIANRTERATKRRTGIVKDIAEGKGMISRQVLVENRRVVNKLQRKINKKRSKLEKIQS